MHTVDPARCPLCGRANACAMAPRGACGEQDACGDCWCTRVVIPSDVIARVPPAAQGRACICAECARGAVPAQDVGRVRD